MNALLDSAALLVSAAAVAALVLGGLTGGRWRDGMNMALLLAIAATLLRLEELPSGSRLGATAVTLVLRQLLVHGLRPRPPAKS